MKIENDDVTLPRVICREIFDHETLLTFNDDDMASAFNTWWNTEGFALFQKFYETWKGF